MGNDVYEEDFVDKRVSNNPKSINFLLDRIKEIHSEDAGWTVGEPEITPNEDGITCTVKVHLTKVKTESYGRSR